MTEEYGNSITKSNENMIFIII